MRQSARVSKAEMHANLMNHLPNQLISWHLADRTKGIDPYGDIDLGQLAPDQRGALMAFYWSSIKITETWHYQFAHGFLDEETWFGLDAPLAAMPKSHPSKQFWQQRKMLYPKAFREAMDDVLKNHPNVAAFQVVIQEARGLKGLVPHTEEKEPTDGKGSA